MMCVCSKTWTARGLACFPLLSCASVIVMTTGLSQPVGGGDTEEQSQVTPKPARSPKSQPTLRHVNKPSQHQQSHLADPQMALGTYFCVSLRSHDGKVALLWEQMLDRGRYSVYFLSLIYSLFQSTGHIHYLAYIVRDLPNIHLFPSCLLTEPCAPLKTYISQLPLQKGDVM